MGDGIPVRDPFLKYVLEEIIVGPSGGLAGEDGDCRRRVCDRGVERRGRAPSSLCEMALAQSSFV
jgi:hypothetical protein